MPLLFLFNILVIVLLLMEYRLWIAATDCGLASILLETKFFSHFHSFWPGFRSSKVALIDDFLPSELLH